MNKILIDQLKGLSNSILLLAFIPYEGKVVNLYDAPILNKLDFGVFYSQYMYDCFDELNTCEAGITDFHQRFGYIHHGVDKQKFYPLSSNRKEKMNMARSFITEYKNLPEDAFIILNSNKPFYRKGIEATLAAFKSFSSQHTNAYLHLHIGSVSLSSYEYMMKSVNEYSLNEHVIVTYSTYPGKAHSDEWMNALYNACNIGLSTSCGEGWGLGIFEHAATGAPVIVPRHTVFIENWKDIALLTDIDDVKYLAFENTEVYLSSVDPICDALYCLYHSQELYEACADRCYFHATSHKFDWSTTSAYFKEILINQRVDVPLPVIT
jgi:D-inositol-3-phosphate glycosyltransferase